VGSPPAPPGRHAAPGGWYADPVDRRQERYWDGWQWSRQTREREPSPTRPGGGHGPTPRTVRPARGATATTADGVRLAEWGWRALAAVLDGVFTALAVTALTFPIYRSTVTKLSVMLDAVMSAQRAGTAIPPLALASVYSTQQRWVLMSVMLAVGLAYQIVFLRWKRATGGKLICRLRVVPVDQGWYAGRLAWPSILVRAVVWVVPGVVGAVVLFRVADALFPLWHPKRQAIHDILAKTQVVRPDRR
jgi:uncharacterized RDD family membrane protein YckC